MKRVSGLTKVTSRAKTVDDVKTTVMSEYNDTLGIPYCHNNQRIYDS